MISAVAARKAALSAQNNLSPQLPPSPPKAVKQDSPAASTPVSKRKSSGVQESNQNIRKKKKVAHKAQPKPKTRYFEDRDVFQGQDDIVSIPSDDGAQDEFSDAIDEIDVDFDAAGGGTKDTLPPKGNVQHWSPSRPVNDSSDEDEVWDLGGPGPSSSSGTQLEASDDILSSFRPIPNQNLFHIDDLSDLSSFDLDLSSISVPATLISLKPDETLTLIGAYKLIMLDGSVSLCGVTLLPSRETYDVFAPRSSPLPVIAACPHDSEKSFDILRSAPQRLKGCFGNENTVILLQELRTNVEGLGRVCRTFDGVFKPSSRYQVDEDVDDIQIAGARIATNRTKDIQPYILPQSWKTALGSITLGEDGSSPGIHFVKGHKNSGKSSFARTLSNQLLTRYKKVAYLECDLGQSEFTPGGMVALNVISEPLFGPPFTHPTLPTHAHYIGSTTPRSSPSHYLTSIQSLIEFYRLDVQTPVFTSSSSLSTPASAEDHRISDSIPLVVNTMGWAKGLGADLTRRIEEMLEPSHIFEFEAPVFDGGWSTGATDAAGASSTKGFSYTLGEVGRNLRPPKYHTLSPIPPESSTSSMFSAADHRTLTILSYFHAVFPAPPYNNEREAAASETAGDLFKFLREDFVQLTAKSWNTSLPLCARYPYEVDVQTALDRVILIGAGAEDVVEAEIERVLGGAVVGLVKYDPGTLEVNITQDDTTGGPTSPLPPQTGMQTQTPTLIPYTQTTLVPSPLTSSTSGLALIRSVAPGGKNLHILTPLPPSLLSHARVVVKGELELPVWGFLDLSRSNANTNAGDEVLSVAGVERGKVPYLQWGKGEGIGGEKRRVRRNLMRKGQM